MGGGNERSSVHGVAEIRTSVHGVAEIRSHGHGRVVRTRMGDYSDTGAADSARAGSPSTVSKPV